MLVIAISAVLVIVIAALSYVTGMKVGWRKAMSRTEHYIPWSERQKSYSFWLYKWF